MKEDKYRKTFYLDQSMIQTLAAIAAQYSAKQGRYLSTSALVEKILAKFIEDVTAYKEKQPLAPIRAQGATEQTQATNGKDHSLEDHPPVDAPPLSPEEQAQAQVGKAKAAYEWARRQYGKNATLENADEVGRCYAVYQTALKAVKVVKPKVNKRVSTGFNGLPIGAKSPGELHNEQMRAFKAEQDAAEHGQRIAHMDGRREDEAKYKAEVGAIEARRAAFQANYAKEAMARGERP